MQRPPPRSRICKIDYRNISARACWCIMAKNGAGSKLNIMATTISSASLMRLACRTLSNTFALALLAAAVLGACNRANTASTSHKKIWEDFSGDKALAHVQAMVDFGPRPPGTEAIEKTRAYLIKQLEGAGWKVERQNFSEDTPRGKKRF